MWLPTYIIDFIEVLYWELTQYLQKLVAKYSALWDMGGIIEYQKHLKVNESDFSLKNFQPIGNSLNKGWEVLMNDRILMKKEINERITSMDWLKTAEIYIFY